MTESSLQYIEQNVHIPHWGALGENGISFNICQKSVAIDNRIEQAMDVVKAHLMLSVRKEVEALKEKISELNETIARLEYENRLLRSHASEEVLLLLDQGKP